MQISEFIEELGDNFDSIMKTYLEDFKKPMKQRLRILISLVEKHYDDICFLVDVDHTYVHATIPMVNWINPLPYEINVDEASVGIIDLLEEDIDKSDISFRNNKEAKSRITIDLKIDIVLSKKKKLFKR